MKKDYVKRQHYIPQFVLRYFRQNNDKIPYAVIDMKPLRLLYALPINIMQERDFYEIKDGDGNHVLRNSIEDKYSYMENYVSPKYNNFINIVSGPNFQKEFSDLVKSEDWPKIESTLLLYLIMSVIRGKKVKNLSFSNSKLSNKQQQIIHLLLTTSPSVTADFVKEMYCGPELEELLHFIKDDALESGLSSFAEHIFTKYQIQVWKAGEQKKFFLSDNPPIIQKFEDEDYILPISPNICICLIPLKVKNNMVLVDHNIYILDDDAVSKVNEQSVLNTEKQIIISNQSDLLFIENIISKNNTF